MRHVSRSVSSWRESLRISVACRRPRAFLVVQTELVPELMTTPEYSTQWGSVVDNSAPVIISFDFGSAEMYSRIEAVDHVYCRGGQTEPAWLGDSLMDFNKKFFGNAPPISSSPLPPRNIYAFAASCGITTLDDSQCDAIQMLLSRISHAIIVGFEAARRSRVAATRRFIGSAGNRQNSRSCDLRVDGGAALQARADFDGPQ